ncbi:MATE family efflux transporter [Shinella curvata]|uniref:Multidrug export protein MepA n=1 Tax=Shinella curvata TaxID=1817964 RepID=A0ABT8X984_9HYPH|nr:MATE family efflux transporter [Shinella curvata]MCJ8051756.1 MATE family efflux transporter [Shinella curvata]MDO6120296.1 MATE family efflux transporter [Shinella curvata]
MSQGTANPFLTAPLGALFAKTASPVVFVMSMNGLLTVVDAVMLGLYAGPEAVAAVTAVFPVFMLLVALATLVGSGMASLLARWLGAADLPAAREIFRAAHYMALGIGAAFILAFLVCGSALVGAIANGSQSLETLAYSYISIVVFFSPIQLLLAVNVDALRCEGRVGLMALASVVISLANLVFNYVLIVHFDMGVAGSALGTVLAQMLALGFLFVFRTMGRTNLRLADIVSPPTRLSGAMREILALGAPQSLGFIGLALVSATVIAALQASAGSAYEPLVTAYGIVTRILTFTYLPLLGMSQAVQAILGQNRGAGLTRRADATLRLGLSVVFVYCLAIQASLIAFPDAIGAMFVDDRVVIDAIARIMPVMTALYVVSGPLMVIAGYFQAIGDAKRAAVLSLAKPYLFTMPLVLVLTMAFGERGLWFAMPTADALLLVLTAIVLRQAASRPSGQ